MHSSFGMCVYGIQFLFEHSTVIYTSIAILHWGFCATAKYPDGVARGGVWYQFAPMLHAHSLGAAWVLRCGNYMRSVFIMKKDNY